MINKNNLVISELLEKDDDGRIRGICVMKDRTVANNGKALIEVTKPKVNPESFPKIPKVDPKQNDDFILSGKSCKEIASIVPKDNITKQRPILRNIVIEQEDSKRASFSTTDLETARTVHSMLIEGQYPDYKQVYPNKQPVLTISLSSGLLEKLCSIIKKTQSPEDKLVKFEFYGPDDAVKLTATNPDTEQEITALIMPMSLEETK